MSTSAGESLSKAYKLIEAEELGAARAILQPILARDPDNADAWWLFAHAVSDTDSARDALGNVLRLDPSYPGARELMDQLEMVTQPAPPVSSLLGEEPEPVAVAADLPNLDDDLENDARRNRLLRIVAAVVILLVLLAVLAALAGGGAQPAPTQVGALASPTAEIGNVAAVSATEEATEAPEVVSPVELAPTEIVVAAETDIVDIFGPLEPTPEMPTDAPVVPTAAPVEDTAPTVIGPIVVGVDTVAAVPTATAILDAGINTVAQLPTTEAPAEPTAAPALPTTEVVAPDGEEPPEIALVPAQGDFELLATMLAGYPVAAEPFVEADTPLGRALIVAMCSSAGEAARNDIRVAMNVMAQNLDAVAADFESIGARLLNCETDREMMFIVTAKDAAASYARGQLTQEQFEALWMPQ